MCLYFFLQNVEATFKLKGESVIRGLLREICVLQFFFKLLVRVIFPGEIECRQLLLLVNLFSSCRYLTKY